MIATRPAHCPRLASHDEAKFDTIPNTYYKQLNGYEYLKHLDIGYFFYSGSYTDDILKALNPAENPVVPRELFLLPLFEIGEAVNRIKNGQ